MIPHDVTFVSLSSSDPESIYQRLLNLLNDRSDILHKSIRHLSGGRIYHQYIFETSTELDNIRVLVDQIKMIPLIFKLSLKKSEYESAMYTGIDHFVKMYVKTKLGIDVTCTVEVNHLTLIIRCWTTEDIELYVPRSSGLFIKLRRYLGSKLVGQDDLIPYVIRNYFTKSISTIDYDSDLLCYITSDPQLNVTDINSIIQGLRVKGYFAMRYTSNDQLSFFMQYLIMWGYSVVEINDNVIVSITDRRDYSITPANPYYMASTGQPFLTRIGGSWQYDTNELDQVSSKLYYIVYQVLVRDPYLAPNFNYVEIHPDLSVTIPCFSIDQVDYISMEVSRMYNSSAKDMYVIEVSDVEKGFMKRMSAGDIGSMIVNIRGRIYVVFERLPNQKNIDKSQVRSAFINYLNGICESLTDPISREDFSDLSLMDLLKVVRPEKDTHYCITGDTLSKLNGSPITRKPFDHHIRMLMEDPTIGIRGFINVGNLINGLFGDRIPDYPDIDPHIDLTVTEYSGNTEFDIIFDTGDQQEVFVINTILDERDLNLVKSIWSTGKLLTGWSKYITSKNGSLMYPAFFTGNYGWMGRSTPSEVSDLIDLIRSA